VQIPRKQLPSLLQASLGRFAREFLPLLANAYQEAPLKAARDWGSGTPEASNNLGDIRHGLIDQAMRRAALAAGLRSRIVPNGRNTWRGTEVEAEPFRVVQSRPDFWDPNLPRYSSSRAAGAELNARQGNLFEDPESELIEVTVGIHIVIVHSNVSGKPGVLARAEVRAFLDLEDGRLLMPAVSLEALARGSEDFGTPAVAGPNHPLPPFGGISEVAEPPAISPPRVVLRPRRQAEGDGGQQG